MSLTTIATFRDATSAHIARAKLEAEGIPAFLADEHLVGVQWLYSDAIGGVKLRVPDDFADRARDVVARDHSRDLRRVARAKRRHIARRSCPSCGSEPSSHTLELAESRQARFLRVFSNRHRCGSCGAVW